MVLVIFKVDEEKAFMTGNTKFYVKRSELVNIETPVVHPLTLGNEKTNDYEFKGWNFRKDNQGNYLFTFETDTEIDDSNIQKPVITIRKPRPNSKNITISEITEGAIGYLEVTRGSNPPVIINSTEKGGFKVFEISSELGGKLNRNDKITVYCKLNGEESEIRDYRVR